MRTLPHLLIVSLFLVSCMNSSPLTPTPLPTPVSTGSSRVCNRSNFYSLTEFFSVFGKGQKVRFDGYTGVWVITFLEGDHKNETVCIESKLEITELVSLDGIVYQRTEDFIFESINEGFIGFVGTTGINTIGDALTITGLPDSVYEWKFPKCTKENTITLGEFVKLTQESTVTGTYVGEILEDGSAKIDSFDHSSEVSVIEINSAEGTTTLCVYPLLVGVEIDLKSIDFRGLSSSNEMYAPFLPVYKRASTTGIFTIKHRPNGIPYILLSPPDKVGPRDTVVNSDWVDWVKEYRLQVPLWEGPNPASYLTPKDRCDFMSLWADYVPLPKTSGFCVDTFINETSLHSPDTREYSFINFLTFNTLPILHTGFPFTPTKYEVKGNLKVGQIFGETDWVKVTDICLLGEHDAVVHLKFSDGLITFIGPLSNDGYVAPTYSNLFPESRILDGETIELYQVNASTFSDTMCNLKDEIENLLP